MKKRAFSLLLICLLICSAFSALADYGAILKSDAKVYRDPKLRSSVGTLQKYQAVVVLSMQSGKAKITARGKTVYIHNRYLGRPWIDFQKKRKKQGIDHLEDCLRYVKKTCYVYDYPGTKAKKLKKVRKGTVLIGFGESGGWSIVMDKTETYYGYIKTSKLEGISGGDGSHYKLK